VEREFGRTHRRMHQEQQAEREPRARSDQERNGTLAAHAHGGTKSNKPSGNQEPGVQTQWGLKEGTKRPEEAFNNSVLLMHLLSAMVVVFSRRGRLFSSWVAKIAFRCYLFRVESQSRSTRHLRHFFPLCEYRSRIVRHRLFEYRSRIVRHRLFVSPDVLWELES
jgi:hypothetical protein